MPDTARHCPAGSAATAPAPHAPSVAALLARVARPVADAVEEALADALQRLERRLFASSEGAGDATAFLARDALRAIARVRAQFLPEVLHRMDAAVQGLLLRETGSAGCSGNWRLVDPDDVAEAGVVAGAAASLEAALHLPIYLLGERLGHLLQREPLPARVLPLGPHRLLDALREACQRLDLEAETRVDLLRLFGAALAQRLPTRYDAANAVLVQAGVLPELVSYRPHARAPSSSASPAPPMKPPPAMSMDAGSLQGCAQRVGSDANGITRSTHWLDLAQDAATAEDTPESEREHFALMRHLLGGRRALLGGATAGGAVAATRPAHIVGPAAIEQVLRELQHAADAGPRTPLANRLRQGLQRFVPTGAVATLTREHTDTAELVDLLFDHLRRDLPEDGHVTRLFARLQAPMLRAALHDSGFFTRARHPARRLLDVLADAGLYWLDPATGVDDPLLCGLRTLVDGVATRYDGNDDVFDLAATAMQQQLAEHVRRSAIIERRHVDAERGRERLDLARRRAESALRDAIGGVVLPPALHGFLVGTWIDVLALTVLRDGDDLFEVRVQAVAELAACVDAGRGCPIAPGPAPLLAVRDVIDAGLRQLGQPPEDAAARAACVVGWALAQNAGVDVDVDVDGTAHATAPLAGTPATASSTAPPEGGTDADAPCVQDIARTAQQSAIDVVDAAASTQRTARAPLVPAAAPEAVLDAAARTQLDRLRRLPFGTWFDLDLDGASPRRCRMSWFSPVTGRCLFVNARGQRAGDTTLAWLAAELAAGRAGIAREPQASVIDAAWQAILGVFRSIARPDSATSAQAEEDRAGQGSDTTLPVADAAATLV